MRIVTDEMVNRALAVEERNIGHPRAVRMRLALESVEGNFEQAFANEAVHEMRRTHFCPTCGADEFQQGGRRA